MLYYRSIISDDSIWNHFNIRYLRTKIIIATVYQTVLITDLLNLIQTAKIPRPFYCLYPRKLLVLKYSVSSVVERRYPFL